MNTHLEEILNNFTQNLSSCQYFLKSQNQTIYQSVNNNFTFNCSQTNETVFNVLL